MLLRLRALVQLAVLAMGCGTATFIVQQYDGPPRVREQIAVLRLNGKDPVRVESLDGERLDYQLKDNDARVHIELLPGVHELAVTDTFGLAEPFRFVAAAGHVYRPIMNPVYRPGSASFVLYEVDAESDEPRLPVPAESESKPKTRGTALPAPVSNSILTPALTPQPALTAAASVQPTLPATSSAATPLHSAVVNPESVRAATSNPALPSNSALPSNPATPGNSALPSNSATPDNLATPK
jgi:hypothetical protein